MISFKKYLDEENDDLTSCLVRVVIRLLEGMSLHAVEQDHKEHSAFRRQLAETTEKFEETTEGRETLIIAREAKTSLQMYNQSVELFATVRVEQEIEPEGRSMFFKAAIAWTLMAVRDTLQASDISRKIDDFAARHSQMKPNTA